MVFLMCLFDIEMICVFFVQILYCIVLLFNVNKVYDCEIISGIGQYLYMMCVVWDLFFEDDFCCWFIGIECFDGDGIIVDFDDLVVVDVFVGLLLLIVVIGLLYEDLMQYLDGVLYIVMDNLKFVLFVYMYLIGVGFVYFVMYSLLVVQENCWVQQCELVFDWFVCVDGFDVLIYCGLLISVLGWNYVIE